nr:alpha/beta hydrolase [Pseudoalteromonas citrea]
MKQIQTKSGLYIHCQDEGKKSAPAIILIMGLGAQMTVWPDVFYHALINNNFRVIRFDNRDVGLSSQLNEHGTPSLFSIWFNKHFSLGKPAPYSLEDMAEDVISLMKELKISQAHLVGASMGGMIAQIIAAKYKKKVLSLTSIMSTPDVISFSATTLKTILKLAPISTKNTTRDSAINYTIKLNQIIGSPHCLPNESTLRAHAKAQVDRAHNPSGIKRQLCAITTTGKRAHLLKNIKVPTLVIHGAADPLFPVSAGINTAKLIKKAKLKIIPELGHDFPPKFMEKIAKWISQHVHKAEYKNLQKKIKKLTK